MGADLDPSVYILSSNIKTPRLRK